MPRYERPECSPLSDFGEDMTAAAWGINDPADDLPPHMRDELGIWPPQPLAPKIPANPFPTDEGVVLGSKDTYDWRSDDYYARKIADGLVD